MQKSVRCFLEEKGLSCGVQSRYIDLTSEVGELGKEILKAMDYGKMSYQEDAAAAEEMGDCLFSILALCCEMNIDAQDVLQGTLRKYQRRFENTGTAGSGR